MSAVNCVTSAQCYGSGRLQRQLSVLGRSNFVDASRARSETVCVGMVNRHFFGRLEITPPSLVSGRLPYRCAFGQLIVRKIIKIVAFPRRKISQKCVCGRGSALDPLGELTALPRAPDP